MYIQAGILKAAEPTVFMAWLPACPPLLRILNQINSFSNPRLQFDCNIMRAVFWCNFANRQRRFAPSCYLKLLVCETETT